MTANASVNYEGKLSEFLRLFIFYFIVLYCLLREIVVESHASAVNSVNMGKIQQPQEQCYTRSYHCVQYFGVSKNGI